MHESMESKCTINSATNTNTTAKDTCLQVQTLCNQIWKAFEFDSSVTSPTKQREVFIDALYNNGTPNKRTELVSALNSIDGSTGWNEELNKLGTLKDSANSKCTGGGSVYQSNIRIGILGCDCIRAYNELYTATNPTLQSSEEWLQAFRKALCIANNANCNIKQTNTVTFKNQCYLNNIITNIFAKIPASSIQTSALHHVLSRIKGVIKTFDLQCSSLDPKVSGSACKYLTAVATCAKKKCNDTNKLF